jgi:hypothetical protein
MTSVKAPPPSNDRDHRDAPLRGGPVMTRRALQAPVIYGAAGNGKEPNINDQARPIPDFAALIRATHILQRHLSRKGHLCGAPPPPRLNASSAAATE